jgi:hypothetical protein
MQTCHRKANVAVRNHKDVYPLHHTHLEIFPCGKKFQPTDRITVELLCEACAIKMGLRW